MKLNFYILFILPIAFVNVSHAGISLQTACNSYKGVILKNVVIQNYNSTTIDGDFSIRTSASTTAWFSVSGDNYNTPYLYDMAKTARLTGERVDICYNPNSNHLLGLEWTNSAS